jgi:cytoskeletal protein CcmA (bactofilin family)
MWSKQQTGTEAPSSAGSSPAPAPAAAPSGGSFSTPSAPRAVAASPSGAGRLGASLQIKGEIVGGEDLQIDGIVNGPISLGGHELIIGPTAQLTSEIRAGEIIVHGKVVGNVHAQGRVDIKKDGSIVGDIESARISIEDGAHFKGRIEIDPARSRQKL